MRLRWIGHALTAELQLTVDAESSLRDAHDVAVGAEHRLPPEVPRLTAATIHMDPAADEGPDSHIAIAHHRRLRQGLVGPETSESLADTRMVR